MHGPALPSDPPSTYACDAFVAHCFAACGFILFLSGHAFFASTSDYHRVLDRFGLIIFFVCAIWSGTLAVRSIWAREADKSSWIILGFCLLELNVPMVLCIPAVFVQQDEATFVGAAVKFGAPLWVPLISLIVVASIVMTRLRSFLRERYSRRPSRLKLLRPGLFWCCMFSIPVLIALPVLLFLYSIAPVQIRMAGTVPRDWRSDVLTGTPHFLTDSMGRAMQMLDIGRPRQAMLLHAWVSAEYLVETIEASKDQRDGCWEAFVGLAGKYPETALQLSRTIWMEPFKEERVVRFRQAAFFLAGKADAAELQNLLTNTSQKGDLRRGILLSMLGRHKRFDLEIELCRIASDRNAVDRLFAISALTEFRSPVVTTPLWDDFFDHATQEQHSAIGEIGFVPSDLKLKIFQRALDDSRPQVLKYWLENLYVDSSDYLERIPLLQRLLELSEHADLNVRRGALRGMLETLDKPRWNFPIPASRSDSSGREIRPEVPESEEERDASDTLRWEVCEILGRRL